MEKLAMTVPPCVKEVTVRLARADERRKWDALMFEHHSLRFIQFAGRGLRYVAEYAGQWLALLGWQSGAFKCGRRDRWIGWGKEQQFGRLNLIANNTRTLVLCEPGEVPNLASYVMCQRHPNAPRWPPTASAYAAPTATASAITRP